MINSCQLTETTAPGIAAVGSHPGHLQLPRYVHVAILAAAQPGCDCGRQEPAPGVARLLARWLARSPRPRGDGRGKRSGSRHRAGFTRATRRKPFGWVEGTPTMLKRSLAGFRRVLRLIRVSCRLLQFIPRGFALFSNFNASMRYGARWPCLSALPCVCTRAASRRCPCRALWRCLVGSPLHT